MKILLLAFLLIGTAFVVKSKLWRPAHEGIEGTWEVASWPEGWKPVPGSHVTITPRDVKIMVGVVPTTTLKYEADPEAETIDTIRQADGKTIAQLGRYHREGNTLTLCMGGEGKPRPAGMDASGDGAAKWVLRQKK